MTIFHSSVVDEAQLGASCLGFSVVIVMGNSGSGPLVVKHPLGMVTSSLRHGQEQEEGLMSYFTGAEAI